MSTLQEEVVTYLTQPNRTHPNDYFNRLSTAGFFNKDEAAQVRILDEVLSQTTAEHSGRGSQFRATVGLNQRLNDLTPEPVAYTTVSASGEVTQGLEGTAESLDSNREELRQLLSQMLELI